MKCANLKVLPPAALPDEIAAGYRRIPLTQGQFATVDAHDFDQLSQWRWTAWWSPHSKSFYAVRNGPKTGGRIQRIIMARVIMDAPDGSEVDHHDHDTLNNRRRNLRIATCTQNNCNKGKRKGCKSRYKGVSWHEGTKMWRARVHFNHKETHIGLYASEEDAARARDQEAVRLHQEFAYVNIPLSERTNKGGSQG